MSAMNPAVLIQLMMRYHSEDICGKKNSQARTFVFTRNNRIRVHRETPEEMASRKSQLDINRIRIAEDYLRTLLKKTMQKKAIGNVWIDPGIEGVAVPLQMSTGNSGYGILPTGSRVPIPEGKFVRAFTYWEKVNDIDLSAFAITEDGRQEEFSWRNMYAKTGNNITYSGDQTSGYNGGSEYFDIDIKEFKRLHPEYRYLVFCDNVFSGINFDKCVCKAGFMVRDHYQTDIWEGEWQANELSSSLNRKIFDPKTVQTSFRINAESMFVYLFAIDLEEREMIWLNMARADHTRVAGTTGMDILLRYFTMTHVISLADLYRMAGNEVMTPEDADVILSDRNLFLKDDRTREQIHSWDFEKVLSLLQAS